MGQKRGLFDQMGSNNTFSYLSSFFFFFYKKNVYYNFLCYCQSY